MSGLTTTGSTVITGLDYAPPGILLWRALLQWIGGIGIIVMAIAILPMLRVGGMQLFRMESSDQSDKAMPRAASVAGAIAIIYLVMTIVWSGAYWLAGMSGFDAIAHAMTTIATGGMSTHDASLGYYDSGYIHGVATYRTQRTLAVSAMRGVILSLEIPGATVLSGLDQLPYSVLLWRSLSQWLGGMGMVVLGIAVLPILGVGGMSLYRAETPGPAQVTPPTPRTGKTATAWLSGSRCTRRSVT